MNDRPGERVFLTAHRPMQALPFDPAPGSVGGVRSLASRLRALGDELCGVRGHLEHPGLAVWSGPTAQRVVRALEDLVVRTDVLTTSVDEAAAALLAWAGRLQDLQERADALDREAAAARAARLDAEQAVAVAAYRSFPLPVEAVQRRTLRHAQADLDAVHARARALAQEYERTAWPHAALLDDAGAGLLPALLRGTVAAWDMARDVEAAVVRPVARYVDTFADATSAAASAADVAAVASVASGPAAAVVAPVAEVSSVALALATTRARLALATGAGGSWSEVGVEAVSVAGGVVTRVPGKAVVAAARSGDVDVDVDGLDLRRVAMAVVDGGPDGATWTVEHRDPGGDASFPLQAHAVADPWDVGPGFAGAAVVGARVPRPVGAGRPADAGATPAGARRPGSSSAAASRPQAPG